jgi:hypothetical protein
MATKKGTSLTSISAHYKLGSNIPTTAPWGFIYAKAVIWSTSPTDRKRTGIIVDGPTEKGQA